MPAGELIEAISHPRFNCWKQLLNDVIFIRFSDEKLFTLQLHWKVHKMTDCSKHLLQNNSSVQKAVFAHSDDDRRRVEINWSTAVWYSSNWESRSIEPITVTFFCHNSCTTKDPQSFHGFHVPLPPISAGDVIQQKHSTPWSNKKPDTKQWPIFKILSLLHSAIACGFLLASYIVTICKMRRFGDTRLLKLPCLWNPDQRSLRSSKVTPFDSLHMVSYYRPVVTLCLKCTVFEIWRHIGWKLPKNLPHPHLARSFGVTPCEFFDDSYLAKN